MIDVIVLFTIIFASILSAIGLVLTVYRDDDDDFPQC